MDTIGSIVNTFPTKQIRDIYSLLEYSTGKTKTKLLANPEYKLKPKEMNKFRISLKKYRQNEPLAYILGYKYFYDSKFRVNNHTLIPRPETETMIEILLKIVSNTKKDLLKILEIGTGSGCISISILKEIRNNPLINSLELEILATDISKEALKIARSNAHSVLAQEERDNLKFKHSDILPPDTKQKFDLILSNPPYITTNQYHRLDPSVRDYEPKEALQTGENGLEIYRRILEKTKQNTTHETHFVFEINPDKLEELQKLVKKHYGNSCIQITKDLYNKNRFLYFSTSKASDKNQK